MNGFVCIVGDAPVADAALRPYAARLARCLTGADGMVPRIRTLESPPFVALFTESADAPRPLAARHGPLLGIGDVRLDNRAEVARRAREVMDVTDSVPDLALVLGAFAARGETCIPELLGDFGMVIWDERTREMLAARDAFGVRALFHARRAEGTVIGSRAFAISPGDALDEEWGASYLAGGYASDGRTPFAGCRHVPAGSWLSLRGEVLRERRWWWPGAHLARPGARVDEHGAVERFRARFFDAVRSRVDGDGTTWAQLSGGLDSSSVVSAAAQMHGRGELPALGGTVTVVDGLGDADETRYSDLVAARWGVRNEQVHDPWMWQDDGLPPPVDDEPTAHYPFWARDRRLCAVVRRAGGRVLLSGAAGDDYLTGDLAFVTDLLAAGRVRTALRQAARFAIAERGSFWAVVGRRMVLPFLPNPVRLRLSGELGALPGWIHPAFARRTGAAARVRENRARPRRDGGHYAALLAEGFRFRAARLPRGPYEDGVEMRYPFLHRPLVEMALGLPPELVIRPGVTKWILREAMRGVLPEEVRVRGGKGGPDARMVWSMAREEPRLRPMLRDPLLAQLGWVDRDGLAAAFERVRAGMNGERAAVTAALALETWLRVASGRWPAGAATSNAA
ncbi:MAG TPA: asparagine synthase-related protein [Longimicrobium sp.]|nr:asparagine synthase-related protein [Longimicrobium sp.]